ncbi:MAG: hypothetical protein KM310_02385 [Clostridiales bacterium]|nr:hypothetical protein [Clostridiales bacterium]
MRVIMHRGRGVGRQRVQELRGYLGRQWDGILAEGEVQRLGAIEAENYHVLAKRLKRRGAAWSQRGAHHTRRLRAAKANGELESYAS